MLVLKLCSALVQDCGLKKFTNICGCCTFIGTDLLINILLVSVYHLMKFQLFLTKHCTSLTSHSKHRGKVSFHFGSNNFTTSYLLCLTVGKKNNIANLIHVKTDIYKHWKEHTSPSIMEHISIVHLTFFLRSNHLWLFKVTENKCWKADNCIT